MAAAVPRGWHEPAVALWAQGKRVEAIQACLDQVNKTGGFRDPELALQCAYYLFLAGDFRAAGEVLAAQLRVTPDHEEVLLNFAVCRSRTGPHQAAADAFTAMTTRFPSNPVGWDGLASALYPLGRLDEAREAGSRALRLKDARALGRNLAPLPAVPAGAERHGGRVIAFSLWGEATRYLRGALRNALLIPDIYPGWTARFYVDDSVPADLRSALAGLGCEVVLRPRGQSVRQKLAWRFEVCNETALSRFLVRDADSVVSVREARAVEEWERSGRHFHVMRDWWTHTDLVLAGMWGGVPGHLPEIPSALAAYRPPHAETPNIDQWFLRDRIWPYMRGSCLIHDRLFSLLDSRVFPGPVPEGNRHVGQDEFSARRPEQDAFLSAWIRLLPCLEAQGG